MKILKITVLAFGIAALAGCSHMPDMKTGRAAVQEGDYETALYHYEELSDFGIPAAKVELGKMYLSGKGVQENPQKALTLFEQASAEGDTRNAPRYIARAQTKIGSAALRNKNSVSSREGVRMLEQAAAAGESRAMFELGYAYEKGIGAPADLNKAAEYYQAAADKGYERAQASLERVKERRRVAAATAINPAYEVAAR